MGGRASVLIELLRERKPVVGAEIGVQSGGTSFQLLRGLPTLERLYCVDAWEWYPDYEHDRCPTDKTGGQWPSQHLLDAARDAFLAGLHKGNFESRVVVLPMMSAVAAQLVPDGSLDFAFLDANHSRKYVGEDIRIWTEKLRAGALLAGHDYLNPHNPAWGVTEAVDEAFPGGVETGDDFTWWTFIGA